MNVAVAFNVIKVFQKMTMMFKKDWREALHLEPIPEILLP